MQVLRTRNAHPMAKACCVAVLNQLLRRASPEVCEEVVVGLSALEPVAGVFAHPVIPLVYKAHAAGERHAEGLERGCTGWWGGLGW